MSTTFDLTSLGLGSGSYVITIAAKGTNWRDSARSTEIAYTTGPSVTTIGFTGLSQSSGALTWTDDIANIDGYTTTTSGDNVMVTSPLDNMFPYSQIREFTDSEGNTFVRYPKMYIKFIYNGTAIDGFKVSNMNTDGDMFIPDCFLNPGDGTSYLDYFALGKYEGSGSTSKLYSKSGQGCLVYTTRANARAAARAYGALSNYYNGYQLEDLSMMTLYNFLCMLYYKTANIQTVYEGRTSLVTKWTSVAATGGCDGVSTLNGWNTSNDCVKILGIENPYGNIFKWIDGISFSDSAIYAHRLPQDFADSTSNAVSLGFSRPTTSGHISTLRAGTTSDAQSYVYVSAVSGSSTTYVGDRCYYGSSGVSARSGGSWDLAASAGLWCLRGSDSATASYANVGARLAYRPTGDSAAYTEEANEHGTTVTINSYTEQVNEHGTTVII